MSQSLLFAKTHNHEKDFKGTNKVLEVVILNQSIVKLQYYDAMHSSLVLSKGNITIADGSTSAT